MSQIKGKDTKPELILRKLLWNSGYRYRINYKITGKPDIAFLGKKVVVFVDGCFWHYCPIHCKLPNTNKKFWKNKLQRNVERDKVVTEKLKLQGWTVIRFWEHQITDDLDACLKKISKELNTKLN